jgi:ATP phosphoribosyltransferase|tara:strand:- start:240 stop:929 length:690 start_codon:yes stop_codon:yes gene_type:complete
MMKNIINIGIPSKGRLRKDILKLFKKNKLSLVSERGERDLLGSIKNLPNVKILYLHAKEIVERLGDGSLDLGFSGYDLLKESEVNIQNKINIVKKYGFGNATLVVAVPDLWLDVQTIADLEEIAFAFKDKKKKRLRVGTKYPNLAQNFLFSKGVTQFKLVNSLGSTELMPFTGSAEIVIDITSTGQTIKANNLRILKDGEILKSEACMMISRTASKNTVFKRIVKLLSK